MVGPVYVDVKPLVGISSGLDLGPRPARSFVGFKWRVSSLSVAGRIHRIANTLPENLDFDSQNGIWDQTIFKCLVECRECELGHLIALQRAWRLW